MTLKCYFVHDSSMEIQEHVFAETRGKAIQSSDAYGMTGEFTRTRAIRKPAFDKYAEQGFIPKEQLLADGWWFECNGKTADGLYCSNQLLLEDQPLIVEEKIYCNKTCVTY